MKLAALALMTISTLGLGIGSAAYAEPGDFVVDAPAARVDLVANGPGQRGPGPLKQALLQRFDRNHDGRLEPQERRQAIRALRKLTRRMARQERRAEQRIHRERQVLRRFDTNRDGVVDPQEMPPGLANRMRKLDRNGDGWLDDADQ